MAAGSVGNWFPSAVSDVNSTLMHVSGMSNRHTTESLGWRRLVSEEIVRLTKGDFVIIVIPADTKREEKSIEREQKELLSRITDSILQYQPDLFCKGSVAKHRKMVFDHLSKHNGIPRSGQTYIELQCIITTYPHRDEYMSSTLSKKDVREHISQGGG